MKTEKATPSTSLMTCAPSSEALRGTAVTVV